MILQDGKVLVQTVGTVVWDNVSRPDDAGKYSLSVALPPSAPEIGELQAIVQQALMTQPAWGGQIPAGGNNPLAIQVDAGKLGQEFTGMLKITGKSNFQPGVVDVNNQNVAPPALGQYVYPGAKVMVILHAYAFDNKAKGVAFGLDGVMVVDNTAPRLAGGGIDAASVFGQALGMPAPGMPAQGMPQQNAPVQQPAQGMPAQGMPQQNAPVQQPAQGMPAQGMPQQNAPVQQPAQGMPAPGMPQQNAPVQQPAQGMPAQGMPQQNAPVQQPAQGMPQQGMPQQNAPVQQPAQGMPAQGMPQQNAPVQQPAQGMPQQSVQPAHDFLQQTGVTPQ